MQLKKVDHLVLQTQDLAACLAFYEKIGFTVKEEEGKFRLYGGDFRLNVFPLGSQKQPRAHTVCAGCFDICLEMQGHIADIKKELQEKGLTIENGIVPRFGVKGPLSSVYLRDPDGNLIELSVYDAEEVKK